MKSSHTSLTQVLQTATEISCMNAAEAFVTLVQPVARFQIALEALLPMVETSELPQRILASYILYFLYTPHPIDINPFKEALFSAFVRERERAVNGQVQNEQLGFLWVLWKILRGDGNDIGPYPPSALARAGLPEEFSAENLTLDEECVTPIELPDTPDRSLEEEHEITKEEDERDERVAQAMQILLHARERTLTLSEQRLLTPMIYPDLTNPPMITSVDLPSIISHNPTTAHPVVVGLLQYAAQTSTYQYKGSGPMGTYLDVLRRLPPKLSTFDLFGRLLRDITRLPNTTVADLIRMEVMPRFIHEAINWVDNAEKDERAGLVSEDVFAKGVRDLCRFYTFLLKMSFVSSSSDADSAEMAHFTLRNSMFEEANALYRQLAMGRF